MKTTKTLRKEETSEKKDYWKILIYLWGLKQKPEYYNLFETRKAIEDKKCVFRRSDQQKYDFFFMHQLDRGFRLNQTRHKEIKQLLKLAIAKGYSPKKIIKAYKTTYYFLKQYTLLGTKLPQK